MSRRAPAIATTGADGRNGVVISGKSIGSGRSNSGWIQRMWLPISPTSRIFLAGKLYTGATAKRFSRVPSMFDSLGVKVPHPT